MLNIVHIRVPQRIQQQGQVSALLRGLPIDPPQQLGQEKVFGSDDRNPTAAEMLNGMPRSIRATTPPVAAMGMLK